MKGVAQIGVQAAVLRTPRGKFGEDAGAEQRDDAARNPDAPSRALPLPTKRATTDGFMKMPEPMMPPITMSAASRARERRSSFARRRAVIGGMSALQRRAASCWQSLRSCSQLLSTMVAQAPPQGPPPAQSMQPPLESGACLDSPRPVPKVLQKPVSRGMQIVRIDEVVSTATMTPGEVIGFLYTTQDGSTWLGQRTADYHVAGRMPRRSIAVLASTHVPGEKRQRVPAADPLRRAHQVPAVLPRADPARCVPGRCEIALVPCVAWPTSRPLPDSKPLLEGLG